jgi:hypothetical protein
MPEGTRIIASLLGGDHSCLGGVIDSFLIDLS